MDFTDFGLQVWEALAPLVLGLLGYGVMLANKWINGRIKNEEFARGLGRLNLVIVDAVKELNQTVVTEYRRAKTNGDGSLTAEEKAKIRDLAIENVKSYLGMKGVKELLRIFGLSEKELDSRIAARVDATVFDLKKR